MHADAHSSIRWRTLKSTLPYVWPKDDWGIRVQVLLALGALVGAKVTNVYVPIIYRDVVDELGGTVVKLLRCRWGWSLDTAVRVF